MKRTIAVITLGCFFACASSAIHADAGKTASAATQIDEKQAADAASRRDYAAAIAEYEHLLWQHPESIVLRLDLADALKYDRQWDRAIDEYQAVLKRQPGNARAMLGIATVRRWQGNLGEARRAYEQASMLAPQDPDGQLGLAATYALDHDYASADRIYDDANRKWPGDSGVQQAVYAFRRLLNPQVYLFWESDLSFATRQGGVIIPFAAQEEFGGEYQEAISYAPELDHLQIYSRDDKRLFYTHYFGLNHSLDFSVRASQYHYNVPDSALEYSSIDTYNEYRIRYTFPLTQEQVLAVRYTARPTTLRLSQDRFTAHKVEAELTSRWNPTLSTQLGGGWLRDLDSNATSTSQLTNRSLVKAGFQWDATDRASFGAKYITNPDLDNTMKSTSIAEGSYSLTEVWSLLGRYRFDNYKTDSNQTSYYAAARYVPDSHWWSEVGLKHAQRGGASGNYGLVSITYRF